MKTNRSLSPFQQALINSVLKDYDAALADISKPETSPKFEKWMQTEVGSGRKRRIAYRLIKGILIAAVITALLAGSALAVPVIREAVIRFFLSERTDHCSITFDQQQAATAPEQIEAYYSISYVPEGYMLAAENISTGTAVALWISDTGSYIQYSQCIMPRDVQSDNWIGIDYEGDPATRIIEGYEIKIIPGKETNVWIWTNNAYIFTLELPRDFLEKEFNKMFVNWVSQEPTDLNTSP